MSTMAKPRARRARLWGLLGLSVLTVLWACSGQNLFGPGSSAPPDVVSITLPAQVSSGQVLDVRARAVGTVSIDSVVVRVRGAFSAENVVKAPAGRLDFTLDTSFQVPDTVVDSVATVEVVATDVRGNSSDIASSTVHVTSTASTTASRFVDPSKVALGKSFASDERAGATSG